MSVFAPGENLVPEPASKNETAAGVGSWASPFCVGSPHAAALWHPPLSPPRHAPGLCNATFHYGFPLSTMIQARSNGGWRKKSIMVIFGYVQGRKKRMGLVNEIYILCEEKIAKESESGEKFQKICLWYFQYDNLSMQTTQRRNLTV